MCDVHWNALLCSTPFHSIVRHLEVVLCSRFHFPQYSFLILKNKKIKREKERKKEKKSLEELRCTSGTGKFLIWRIPLIVQESTPVIKRTGFILILNWYSFSCSPCTFCYLRFLPTVSFLLLIFSSSLLPLYSTYIHPRCSYVWTIFVSYN
jgi:hypothetical protein